MKQTIETICTHAGHPQKGDRYGTHVMPIYQTSTFSFENVEAGRRFFAHEEGGASHSYSRLGNPTVDQLENLLARLETSGLDLDAESMVFGSGMAAITTAMLGLAGGKRIIAQRTLYGCTAQFLAEEASQFGIEVDYFDENRLDLLEKLLSEKDDVAIVFLESIANPTLRISDLEQLIGMAHKSDALVMVDNTFATPYHLRPLVLGADIVMHSTTKYLSGHGTVIGGVLAAREGFFESSGMHTYRKNFGGVASPFDAWLTLMGIKTFALRMEKHAENAMEVARFLEDHPKVDRVFYPGLESHPDHQIAMKLMENGYGGVISFELKEGFEAGVNLMDSVELCTLAVSLGNVDTLIQHPASMTHSVMDPQQRIESGITDGLVRLSVGLESLDDLITDLDQALIKI